MVNSTTNDWVHLPSKGAVHIINKIPTEITDQVYWILMKAGSFRSS